MRKMKKRTFSELVHENKLEIMRNQGEMEKIERKLEEKHAKKAQ
ncbi:FbpB family small basic protein [Fervidibacillus albus]|uniref:FbpB family small basic protein n=1 Tax=Fervidibacillus albus TaxID=2980026 RepID=A0A9E8LX11_9BACI|nr:FbpB family small basic protein [Fervidibacillus albus]WAA10895.1 FbpB family small basic protein [Fervidibacillus albus]